MKSLELQVISSILADLVTKMTGSRFSVASLMPAWLVASVINVSGTHQWAWNEDERSRALVRKQIMIRNLSSQSIVSISN
jgi:YD repeat-containing protein